MHYIEIEVSVKKKNILNFVHQRILKIYHVIHKTIINSLTDFNMDNNKK